MNFIGTLSTEFMVLSGIPQSISLESLLFLIFINHLPSVTDNATSLIFAEDLNVFNTTYNNYSSRLLQQDINSVFKWTINNQLNCSINKWKLWHKLWLKTPLLTKYKMSRTCPVRVDSAKYIIVHFKLNSRW